MRKSDNGEFNSELKVFKAIMSREDYRADDMIGFFGGNVEDFPDYLVMFMVLTNRTDVVMELLNRGGKIKNAILQMGVELLGTACLKRDIELVRMLLESEIQYSESDLLAALELSRSRGDIEMSDILSSRLNSEVAQKLICSTNYTAADHNFNRMIVTLLNQNSKYASKIISIIHDDTTYLSKKQKKILMCCAIMGGHADVLNAFLRKYPLEPKLFENSLALAYLTGNTIIIYMLLSHSALRHTLADQKDLAQSFLHEAVALGREGVVNHTLTFFDIDVVQFIKDINNDEFLSSWGVRTLYLACKYGRTNIAEALLQHEVMRSPKNIKNALTDASIHNKVDIVRILESVGIDDETISHALKVAIFNKSCDVVKALLSMKYKHVDTDVFDDAVALINPYCEVDEEKVYRLDYLEAQDLWEILHVNFINNVHGKIKKMVSNKNVVTKLVTVPKMREMQLLAYTMMLTLFSDDYEGLLNEDAYQIINIILDTCFTSVAELQECFEQYFNVKIGDMDRKTLSKYRCIDRQIRASYQRKSDFADLKNMLMRGVNVNLILELQRSLTQQLSSALMREEKASACGNKPNCYARMFESFPGESKSDPDAHGMDNAERLQLK